MSFEQLSDWHLINKTSNVKQHETEKYIKISCILLDIAMQLLQILIVICNQKILILMIRKLLVS